MANRRGFLAELNYQMQQSAKQQQQRQAAAYRSSVAAQREAERAQKAYERATAAAARSSEAERKAAEREAARLHVEARLAEVEAMNATLADDLAAVDGLLTATLDVDDYVDLEALKISTVEHPPFEPGGLAIESPAVPAPNWPIEPVYLEPLAPRALIGGKKKHEEAIAAAQAKFAADHQRWQEYVHWLDQQYRDALTHRAQAEAVRADRLAAARSTYDNQCRQREDEAAQHNAALTKLINDLAFDVEAAIQEYVGIVLANSVYPSVFPVSHEHEFHLTTRELTLEVLVPEPSALPAVKEHKYVRAKDEIAPTALPIREQKDRYANAVWQVAVRTLHEVFEADRAGKIHSIALRVGVRAIDPATGRQGIVPFVVVAVDRETFRGFNLGNVVPHATLEHLGAALSKSPFDLTPADTSRGVRTRGQ